MFSLVSGFLDWYYTIPTLTILIVGDEQSGKTVSFIL